jgi:g-D-glutamyl-meso-diaminopimelate peptidase
LELTPDGSAYAGYKDWFIQAYDRPGYTIEAGSGINPLPLDQLSKIYQDNAALLSYAQIADSELD